jgi:hypothetical protein
MVIRAKQEILLELEKTMAAHICAHIDLLTQVTSSKENSKAESLHFKKMHFKISACEIGKSITLEIGTLD